MAQSVSKLTYLTDKLVGGLALNLVCGLLAWFYGSQHMIVRTVNRNNQEYATLALLDR
jgi:hypothetical protein